MSAPHENDTSGCLATLAALALCDAGVAILARALLGSNLLAGCALVLWPIGVVLASFWRWPWMWR